MSQLEKLTDIKGKILVKTGLHIGCGTEGVEIGGIDNAVVKDAMTGLPYIPGSSLKGKVRSLLEITRGIRSGDKSKPCSCGECDICRVFGTTARDSEVGPTRAIFRDAFLSEESLELLDDRNLLATESKSENSINRITGTALNPRFTERVIPGLEFDFRITVRVFQGDGSVSTDLLKEGLGMLQEDALGGSTSRGYGKIEFRELSMGNEPFTVE